MEDFLKKNKKSFIMISIMIILGCALIGYGVGLFYSMISPSFLVGSGIGLLLSSLFLLKAYKREHEFHFPINN